MPTEAPPTIEEVCDRAVRLPCSPSLLPRLVAAMDRPDSSASEVEGIIRLDSALAAATLRLANSAHVASSEPIVSLDVAILLLGHREIYRIASLSLLSRWEDHHQQSLPWEPGDYMRHSLCTALAAEALADENGALDPAAAYTIGLVGDVGKLALAYLCAREYPKIAAIAGEGTVTWDEAERRVLGYSNCEVGARLLRGWKFPEPFANAIAFQDSPEKAPADLVRLVALLHAARFAAVTLGPGVTAGGFLFNLKGAFLEEWGYTSELLERVLVDVRERAVKRLGERLSTGVLKR